MRKYMTYAHIRYICYVGASISDQSLRFDWTEREVKAFVKHSKIVFISLGLSLLSHTVTEVMWDEKYIQP